MYQMLDYIFMKQKIQETEGQREQSFKKKLNPFNKDILSGQKQVSLGKTDLLNQ